MPAPKPARTCMRSPITSGAAYCGRRTTPITNTSEATCADCHAAFRADEQAAKTREDQR